MTKVKFDPFFLHSLDELAAMIRDLGEAMGTNATAIAIPQGGSITYGNRRDAMAAMKELQRSYLARTGRELESSSVMKYHQVVVL